MFYFKDKSHVDNSFMGFLGSKVAIEVENVINSATLQRDVRQLAPGTGTAVLESFHSVLINFAPKSQAYSYKGMLSR